jgi:acetamidase/formamidase
MQEVAVNRVATAVLCLAAGWALACAPAPEKRAGAGTAVPAESPGVPEPRYRLTRDHIHSKFSSTIPPALRVPSGAVVEIFTHEATGGQLDVDSTPADVANVDWDRVHALTGPIHVETAEPGDVLAVTLHEVEVGDWGWTSHSPDFGFLGDEIEEPWLRTFRIEKGQTSVTFAPGVEIPLRPFPGVIGVAPATEELLSTIPPRANGGNMDNKHMIAGTTVYLPVFVEGALLSVGDTHAAQGDGEVCGTAIEAPMRLVLEVNVRKGGRSIPEPEFETAEFYATTAFAETIDEAARKATRYMIDYLVAERGLTRGDAYALASLAGDLKINEVVDVPHVLVSMHVPKAIFR